MFQIFKRHQNTSAQLSGSIKVCIIDYPVKLAFIQLSILQITMETSRKLNDEENDFDMNIDTDQEDFLDISEDNADEMQMDSSQASKGSSNFGNKTDCEDELNSKAMRGKATDWITEVEFTSKKEYLESPALQDLVDNYNMHSKKINKDGDITRVFLCRFSKKKKGFACPVKRRSVQTGDKMTIFRQEGSAHKHTPMKEGKRKHFVFPPEAEKKMEELLEMNVTSRKMRKHLIEKGYFTEATAPTDSQFYAKTNKLRKRLNLDRRSIGLREFEDIIAKFSVEPEDPDEPFVVKYTKPVEEKDGKLRYSVMFSSKNLIKSQMNPGKPWVLSLDATYQTNTEDCPLIFFGSSEKDGQFRGVGAILSNREDELAYDFLFEFVKENASPSPDAIMADGAKAITNSARRFLPDSVRLMCFFHVMENVKEKLSKVKKASLDVYNRITDDIHVLQTSSIDAESFKVLYSLLKKKWMKDYVCVDKDLKMMITKFFEYFTQVSYLFFLFFKLLINTLLF